jgi:hypothetical protein
VNFSLAIGTSFSLKRKVRPVMNIPAMIAGVTILVKLKPPALRAVTSESEESLPKATRFERSNAIGKLITSVGGKLYMKNSETTENGTPLEKIRLINSIIRSISQIATKKDIPKRNGSSNSFRMYLSTVLMAIFIEGKFTL